jgi:hypothetical protein
MFRNPISGKLTGSAVRKTTSVGLLVAGVVATSPFSRGGTTCTAAEAQLCMEFCGQLLDYCVPGYYGGFYCECS